MHSVKLESSAGQFVIPREPLLAVIRCNVCASDPQLREAAKLIQVFQNVGLFQQSHFRGMAGGVPVPRRPPRICGSSKHSLNSERALSKRSNRALGDVILVRHAIRMVCSKGIID
jgi:hypothetical protein